MRHSAFSRHVSQQVYWPCQHEFIRRLMVLGETVVACDPEDETHLYGAICHQPGAAAIVHWLYVKGDYRRMGVARALMQACIGDKRPILCTQAPALFNDRAAVDKHQLVYCPYLLVGIAPSLPARAPVETDECPSE